jgi:hypothetical protein
VCLLGERPPSLWSIDTADPYPELLFAFQDRNRVPICNVDDAALERVRPCRLMQDKYQGKRPCCYSIHPDIINVIERLTRQVPAMGANHEKGGKEAPQSTAVWR